MSAHRELVKRASVLYKARLSSNPFYQARMEDEQFWSAYVGSAIVEARELVLQASKTAGP